jgi:hypothetical protein
MIASPLFKVIDSLPPDSSLIIHRCFPNPFAMLQKLHEHMAKSVRAAKPISPLKQRS